MVTNIVYRTNSVGLFKIYWIVWRIIGVQTFKNIWIRRLYDALLNIFITIWYPVHLTVGLILLPMHGEIFRNLSMTITCIVCSLKYIFLRKNMSQLRVIEELLAELDVRSQSREELEYFNQKPKKQANRLANLFLIFYMGANLTAILSVMFDSNRRLMYPAWFPFDWRSSSLLYWLALLYQFVGVSMQIVQNLANDLIAPVTLCLLGGHVRLLSMRVANLGYDKKKSPAENVVDLNLCVEDHIKLLQLFKVAEDSLSFVQFILFFSSGLNICVVLVYLLFYVEGLFACLYYSIFTVAIVVEVFPCYFYGSWLQQEFEQLPYAIFCSNWIEQPKQFRQGVLIFTQSTLRKLTMMGGGIVGIHLESFFAICKTAYSLFALVIRIK